VFELPDRDYERLGRLVPLLVDRQWVLEAAGADLLADGFPLLPTRGSPLDRGSGRAQPGSVRPRTPALLRAEAEPDMGRTTQAIAWEP
jgi:hypothetical protein